MRLIDGSVRGTPNVTKVTVAGGGQSVAVQCGVEKPLRRRRVLDAGTGLPSTNESVLPTRGWRDGSPVWIMHIDIYTMHAGDAGIRNTIDTK